jgi:hypothetical protein
VGALASHTSGTQAAQQHGCQDTGNAQVPEGSPGVDEI